LLKEETLFIALAIRQINASFLKKMCLARYINAKNVQGKYLDHAGASMTLTERLCADFVADIL